MSVGYSDFAIIRGSGTAPMHLDVRPVVSRAERCHWEDGNSRIVR